MKRSLFNPFWLGMVLVGAGVIIGCAGGSTKSLVAPAPAMVHHDDGVILDFEAPNPAVVWNVPSTPTTDPSASTLPAASSEPAGPSLTRSALRPENGLWCMTTTLRPEQTGGMWHAFVTPVNFQNDDTLVAGVMHVDSPARSGEWSARVVVRDDAGKEFVGDALAITTKWQDALLDLHDAAATVDLAHVAGMGVRFEHVSGGGDGPLTLQTDTWAVRREHHAYVGARLGMPKSFYVQRDGSRLTLGRVNQYEITFFERSGIERPWMTITQNVGTEGAAQREMVVGQAGTGLMLLDQDMYDAAGNGRAAGCGDDILRAARLG